MDNLIIFDFYGVISKELAPTWFRNHFNEQEAKILKDKYFIPGDLGKYDIYEIFHMIANDFNLNYNEILNEFKSYAKLNDELINNIKDLRKNNTVALLSNACKGIFDLCFPNLDLNSMFDKVFISCNYHLIKPNFEFYNLCKNSFKKEFDQVFMIDDNINNINHLNEINIIGIQFKNNQELYKEFKKYGLK